jgi:predicted extracellular nuclease
MKYVTTLCVFLASLLFSTQLIAQNTENKELDMVFYNAENLFDTQDDPATMDEEFTPSGEKEWTRGRYNKKVKDVAKVLTSTDFDGIPEIVGLAEVENKRVLNALLRTEYFSGGYYGIVHKNSPDVRGIDVALLYKTDAFKLLHKDFIPIQFPFDKESKVRDILYAKGVAGSDTLHFFVNHWKSRAGGREETEQKRTYSARVLKAQIDSILNVNADAKIVAMGDFNDEPTNKSLSKVLGAKNPEGDDKQAVLYNLMYPKDKEGKGTYSYKYEWFMLDNFIVSAACLEENGYHTSPENVHIFDPPWVLYDDSKAGMKVPNRTYGGDNYFGGISDHLAIYGVFKLSKN